MFKKIAIRTLVVFLSLLFCLFLFELTLRTGWFDGEDNQTPIWIPNKFQKIDDEINKKNWELAKHNPYRFTDKVRDVKKKTGVLRIAVIGDSFIWGYGLPYEQVWSHKLEKKITQKYKNIEVMSWGQSAWATMDELSFLEKYGIQYDINMLIVGFVDNDPFMGDIELKHYNWQKNILIKVLKIIFPDSVSFIISYTNNLLTKFFYEDYQYQNWLKALYSDDNLQKYQELLQDFSRFCNSKNIKLLFVLAPQSHNNIIGEEFNKIIPLLEQADIKYLNLFPVVKKDLGHINVRKLWANPANGHPGPLLTELFADEVLNYLERQGILLNDKVSHARKLAEYLRKNEKDSRAAEALVNIALYDIDWDVRKEAAVLFGKINNSSAIDRLIDALNDKNPDIREAAADALGEIKDSRAITPLIAALQDNASHVRKRVILALEKKNDPSIIDPLINIAIKDDDKYVRRRALLALSNIEDDRVVNCLIHSLKEGFYYNRKTAVIALGKTKSPLSVTPLIELLKNDVRDIRTEAAVALGEIGDSRAVEALKIASLKDEDPYVRDLAADAIKKLTGKEFGKYRRKLMRMWQML